MKPDDLINGQWLRDTDLDGEPPSEAPALGPFGRYLLLEELGRGGAAIVYRALDPLLNRELALKRLRFGDLELEMRFLREAELLAKLSHPGIVPVFDFGKEGESHYYTMPLAPGLSFDKWIAEHRPSATDAARMVRRAAEALAHAHERGVLHRDVKPANMLVSAEGAPLLSDFGLGRKEDPGGTLGRVTESGEVMGTPSYMAPELATRDLKSSDARCDVYSLGATLYEALTGRPPFLGESALEILKKATTEEPAAPHRLAPGVPADLEIVCLKALEKDPARRYATARELADDLGRFLEGEPVLAHRPSVVYRARRFVGRRKAIMAVALAGALVAAGVGIYSVVREYYAAARRLRSTEHLVIATRHADNIHDWLKTKKESDAEVQIQATLAHAEIDKALDVDPENPNAYFLRGRVHSLLFEKDEARRHYSLAIQKGPLPRANLERAILDCQDLAVAISAAGGNSGAEVSALRGSIQKDLEAYASFNPDPGELLFGDALLQLSRFDTLGFQRAAELLKSYTEQTRDWRGFFWRGVAELGLRQFQNAQDFLQVALDSRQNTRASAVILDRLGAVAGELGRIEEAEVLFRRAIDLDPVLFESKVHLAIVVGHLGKTDECVDVIEGARELRPGSPWMHAIRAQAYVTKHIQQQATTEPLTAKQWLKSAKESLEVARTAYPPESLQRQRLDEEWNYVLSRLEY